MTVKDRIIALTLAVIFGLGWVFGKAALDHFPPINMAGFRFGCAALALLPFLRWPDVPFHTLVLVSALAISLPYSLSNYGLAELDASVTVLLVQFEAPLLIVMSALFLREIPSRIVLYGVGVAVCGVVFVAGTPAISGDFIPVAVVIVSMIIWGAGQLMIRKLQVRSSANLLGVLSLMATPQLFLFSFLYGEPQVQAIQTATATNWLQVVYLGLVMTAGGIGIWYFLISRYPINYVAPYLLLVPVVSIIGSVVFLGEVVSGSTLFGGALIVTGVAIATMRSRDAPLTRGLSKGC